MLEDLVNGIENSRLVLVTDTADCPGRTLFLNWVKSLAERLDRLILICFERQPEFFKSWLPLGLQNRITFVDGQSITCDFELKNQDLFKVTTAAVPEFKGQTGVLIDSLSLHILFQQTPAVCSALHRLASDKRFSQVVAVLHRDVHDPHTCSLMEHVASSVISLRNVHSGKHICHVRHCRPTGKVFRTVESFTVDDSFHIRNLKPHQSASENVTLSQVTPEADPISQLSFNLSLTETEKVARSQVKLPHLKTGFDESSEVDSTLQSKIHYEADDADDFDEEDPDDDLNI
ncbi:elongator complex protein 5 [Aplysia californica]|uniref:Elongator complex protein 5 n=1 Tax=Aplysia californica TaxID=6500 RepID=A0ABM0K0Q2_APLCA|nr:elongator complex protein 5 [Aplysia californica]